MNLCNYNDFFGNPNSDVHCIQIWQIIDFIIINTEKIELFMVNYLNRWFGIY